VHRAVVGEKGDMFIPAQKPKPVRKPFRHGLSNLLGLVLAGAASCTPLTSRGVDCSRINDSAGITAISAFASGTHYRFVVA
jgi:hypothetical protein